MLCLVPAWNEARHVGSVVRSVPRRAVDCICVVDDGSTDGTVREARRAGAVVLSHGRNRGVGAAIRSGIAFGVRGGFDAVVVVSGSGKTPCEQIPALLKPLLHHRADFVQGSRFLSGGNFYHAPMHRRVGTSLYTLMFSLLAGRKISDASCGFRAFRLQSLQRKDIRLSQSWLDRYELEAYLLFKVVRSDIPWIDVPVTVVYPVLGGIHGYSKMRAVIDWWSIFRPVLFCAVGLKK